MPRTRPFLTLVLCALIAHTNTSSAQKATTPSPTKHELATENVKELLLLMDTDKNGKISKKEWMEFMESEFDRLDKDKSGQLDPKELVQSRVLIRQPRFAAQGK